MLGLFESGSYPTHARSLLACPYEAASALMTRFKRKDKVKTWGRQITKRSCHRKACVAVARKFVHKNIIVAAPTPGIERDRGYYRAGLSPSS